MPIGTILAFAGTRDAFKEIHEPNGWRLCEGQKVKIMNDNPAHQLLYSVLQHSWNDSDSHNCDYFRLPDLRGQFLRGVADNKVQDPDIDKRIWTSPGSSKTERVGTMQPYAVQQHSHTFNTTSGGHPELTNNYAIMVSYGHSATEDTGLHLVNDIGPIVIPKTRDLDPNVSTETRPKNVYVYYMIYVGRGVVTE